MGLYRITQNSKGIEEYLEDAKMSGRLEHRNELDERVHLGGDLDTLSEAIKYTRKHKEWDNHYWHITHSYAFENNDLDTKTLQAITKETLEYYFCNYDIDNLIYHAEAHRPKIQSKIDKVNDENKQRLLHQHIPVSKYDKNTGNQIRMIPFNYQSDKAFQSYICQKYNLVDPATRPRKIEVTKRDLLNQWNGDNEILKQTKIKVLRGLFSESINSDQFKNIDEVKELLMTSDIVTDVVYKKTKNNNYLHVVTVFDDDKSKRAGKKIEANLRGKGFELLEESLYYTKSEIEQRIKEKKHKKILTMEENFDIFSQHQKWWKEQELLRKPKNKQLKIKKVQKIEKTVSEPDPIRYQDTYNKFESYYERYTKQQRIYFIIYKDNIEEKLINGYKVWEKNNVKYLINLDKGIKIFDKPDQISLEIPNDREARREAVALALSIAQDKGWDLTKIKISGSFEFQQEVKKQIAEIEAIKQKQEKNDIIKPKIKPLVINKGKVSTRLLKRLNVVSQALKDAKEKQTIQLSKDQITNIKLKLDAHKVLIFAQNKYKILDQHFTVTNDNKINDNRNKQKPKNVVDFLTKSCNIPIQEALKELNFLYKKQLKKPISPQLKKEARKEKVPPKQKLTEDKEKTLIKKDTLDKANIVIKNKNKYDNDNGFDR